MAHSAGRETDSEHDRVFAVAKSAGGNALLLPRRWSVNGDSVLEHFDAAFRSI